MCKLQWQREGSGRARLTMARFRASRDVRFIVTVEIDYLPKGFISLQSALIMDPVSRAAGQI